jgi:pectinesterase inhibitor-like protein
MAASTPTLSAILVLFVVAAITGGSVAVRPSTALDEVCGGLGGYYVKPELCVSALCPDPPSSSPPCRAARDANAVAAIAARLAAANATATRDSVQAAISSYAGDAAGKAAALRSCLKLYGGVVPALQWAARSVAAGRFRGAREMMQAAQYVPAGCDGMVDGGAALPSENEGFATMATVAHAVLATLSKGY